MSNKSTNFDLTDSISKLKELEEYLFQTLEAVSMTDTFNPGEQDAIIDKISDLSTLRDDLFNQLGVLYVGLNNNAQIERSALTDQATIQKMLENQLANLKQEVTTLENIQRNKTRMVEIGQYEYLRYSAHKSFMKTLAFTSLAILIFSALSKNDIIPKNLATLFIVASAVVGGILLIQQYWNMSTRNNQNYNRFNFPPSAVDASGIGKGGGNYGYPDTVWEHDKTFFKNLWGGVKADIKKDYSHLKKDAKEAEARAEAAAKAAANAAQRAAGSVSCPLHVQQPECTSDSYCAWDSSTSSCRAAPATLGLVLPAEGFRSIVHAAPEQLGELRPAPFN